MANKGNSRHINRLASTKYMKVGRKTSAYVAKPNPGRHALDISISLGTVLKEKLAVVQSLREAELMLHSGFVMVNGKVIKDRKYPVGFNDVIELIPSKEKYSVSSGKNGVFAIKKSEGKQLFKVLGKYTGRKGAIMIRLHDGATVTAGKDVKVNDTVELLDGKPGNVIKMETGRKCFVMRGTHASESGVIKDINQGTATRSALVRIEGGAGEFETLLDNIMVTG